MVLLQTQKDVDHRKTAQEVIKKSLGDHKDPVDDQEGC